MNAEQYHISTIKKKKQSKNKQTAQHMPNIQVS